MLNINQFDKEWKDYVKREKRKVLDDIKFEPLKLVSLYMNKF